MISQRESRPRRCVAIGTFDGVHRGHIRLLKDLKELSASLRLSPAVLILDRHPLSTLKPELCPPSLSTLRMRKERIAAEGVEPIEIRFDKATASMTARQWIETINQLYGVEALLLGFDSHFGSDGKQLTDKQLAAEAAEVDVKLYRGEQMAGYSSTAIRNLLQKGDVKEACRLLGHPYCIEGKVVRGEQLGRKIGFPTANLRVDGDALIPSRGVYAATAITEDGKNYPSMVNIGSRPTVGDNLATTIEAYLDGFSGNLYDKTLTLCFKERLRDEKKFDSLEKLQEQLKKDLEAAKKA